MAFSLNVGSITDLFSDLFIMSLQNGDDQQKLPCKIIELMQIENYGIPTMPLDNNSFINDTIYKNPIQLQLQVFVSENDFDTFSSLIEKTQNSKKGFIVNGINDSYINMRLEEKSYSESGGVVGGVMMSLSLKETLFIESYNEQMTKEQVQKLQDSLKVEGGTKISNKKSTAYSLAGDLVS